MDKVKKLKKKPWSAKRMWTMEGNQGGDYLSIRTVDEKRGIVHIECGHCCVKFVDHILPIEMVSHIIHDGFLKYTGDHGISSEDMIKGSNWPERLKIEMLDRLKKSNLTLIE